MNRPFDLIAAAAAGALVLTVNKRLARHLQQTLDQQMAAQGTEAWQTPRICSLDAWLLRSLAELGDDWRFLDGFSARRLWEDVIEADAASTSLGLLQVPASAQQAAAAHQLLVEYGAAPHDFPLTEDHLAFLRWRECYLDRLQAGRWLDAATVPELICRALATGDLVVPDEVFFVGFDEVTPRLRGLMEALERAGCRVREIPPAQAPAGALLRIPCTDAGDEVRRAARWARGLLEAGAERIGIVVSDLNRYRLLIERIFREELDPLSLVRLDDEEERFSLSLGETLSDQGPITAALEILGSGASLSLDQVSFLLRTPYLRGNQTESGNRARLDKAVRSLRCARMSRSRLKSLASKDEGRFAAGAAPLLVQALEALEKGEGGPRRRLASEWVRHVSQVLLEAGWPGDRPLGSREFQVIKAWQEKVLAAMIALDSVSGPMERGTALSLLRRLASETLFQPEGPTGPLHVVGVLEAAGLHFDHLWVMGLAEDTLPAAPRPNPFLPPGLQVRHGMPHASAERQLAFARQICGRLFAAAPAVILSHPTQQGESPVRPSPLIAGVATGEVDLAPSSHPVSVLRRDCAPLEPLFDPQGPPLRPGERMSGGTAILRDQALCPFRAFAHHRLGAAALDAPQLGLDAPTRGTLLHAVLERFWTETKRHADLVALSADELTARVRSCVESALEEEFSESGADIFAPLLKIESRRLAELVREWLDTVERGRWPFAVEEMEKQHQETFGGLTFNTKVDRIDRLADGSLAILDYKTGRPEVGDLLGERLLEPQLPIYGIGAGEGSIAAVTFAMIRRGECAFKGVARDGGLLPGIAPLAGSKLAEKEGIADWQALLERWTSQLDQLGSAFVAGEAAVDPVDVNKACTYCDLAALCRIGEAALRLEDEA